MKDTYEIKFNSGMVFLVEIELKYDIDDLLNLIGLDTIEYCEAL